MAGYRQSHNFGKPEKWNESFFLQYDRMNELINRFRSGDPLTNIDQVIYTCVNTCAMLAPYKDLIYYDELADIKKQVQKIKTKVNPADEEEEIMRLIFRKKELISYILYSQNMSPSKFAIPIVLHKGTKSYEIYQKELLKRNDLERSNPIDDKESFIEEA